jgi:recombinational DNA repair protein RecT
MAKKTVFKRLSKWLPVTPELQDAIEKDNEEYQHDAKEFNRAGRVAASDLLKKKSNDDVIDVETPEGEQDVNDVI